MNRPSPAELARYRDKMVNGRWQMFSTGIGLHLLTETDALRADMDRRERAAFEAGQARYVDEPGQPARWSSFERWKAAQATSPEPPAE
jgi:hypothetical protein